MATPSDDFVDTADRNSPARALVRKLIAERNKTLVLFCRAAGLEPYADGRQAADPAKVLQEFCQVLVDYIAAGHFSLYEQAVHAQDAPQELLDLAARLYPGLAETTEIALDFNDEYNCGDHCPITDELQEDLSRLGEALAWRIELEDQLARALCRTCDLRQSAMA